MSQKNIEQIYEIKAPSEEVWQALTNPEYIEEWGDGPVKMDDKVGTEFEFWGGDIFGKNIEVVKNKKLKQEWYGDHDWKEPSIVTFILEPMISGTKLTLTHSNIPDDREEEFAVGWQEFYLGPLKDLLEKK